MPDPNNVDEYFDTQPPPPELGPFQAKVHEFIQYQLNKTDRPVVIVTVGLWDLGPSYRFERL